MVSNTGGGLGGGGGGVVVVVVVIRSTSLDFVEVSSEQCITVQK